MTQDALSKSHSRERTQRASQEQVELADVVAQLKELAAFVDHGEIDAEPVPESVGRYRIIDQVGRGGQARVLLGYDPDTRRSVVIKWYLAKPLGDTDVVVDEARALCAVEHPGVCQCYDVDVADSRPYLVLQPVPGESLMQRVLRQPPSCEQAIEWVAQICTAVDALHRCGWIHGDITPRNILLDQDDRPVLIDFGLARRLGDTSPSTFGGTYEFRAPELADGQRSLADPRSDIYSLGKVLAWILDSIAGKPETQHRRIAGLDSVLRRTSRVEPEGRQWTASELEIALQQCLRKTRIRRHVIRGLAAASLVAVFTLMITIAGGWAATQWSRSSKEAALAQAWHLFQNESPRSPTKPPRLKSDFDLRVDLKGCKVDDQGRYLLDGGQPVDLLIRSDQPAFATVYVLRKSIAGDKGQKRYPAIKGTQLAPLPSRHLRINAGEETRIFLEPVAGDGTTELIYVLATTEPWSTAQAEQFPGSVEFQSTDSGVTLGNRGLRTRIAVAEWVVPFVVR